MPSRLEMGTECKKMSGRKMKQGIYVGLSVCICVYLCVPYVFVCQGANECLYVSICVYVCLCLSVCVYVFICVYVGLLVYAYIYAVYQGACVSVYFYMCLSVCMCLCVYMCLCLCVFVSICVYLYVCLWFCAHETLLMQFGELIWFQVQCLSQVGS